MTPLREVCPHTATETDPSSRVRCVACKASIGVLIDGILHVPVPSEVTALWPEAPESWVTSKDREQARAFVERRDEDLDENDRLQAKLARLVAAAWARGYEDARTQVRIALDHGERT